MKRYLPLLTVLVLAGCVGEKVDSVEIPISEAGSGVGGGAEEAGGSGTAAVESDHDHSAFQLTGDNTQVLFTGTKKSGDNHSGGFKTLSGEIKTDDGKVESIVVTIETASLFSDADRLTGHLKNEDFFSVNEFPEMKFESTSVEGDGDITVTGTLSMHGETGEVSFPATASVDGDAVTLTSEFKVDRTKFGMNYVGKPEDPINADVDIKIIVGKSE